MPVTTAVLAGRYRLEARIAVGGVGEVWRATDRALARPVAVKLLRPEYTQDRGALTRFRAEARHAGSLAHPGIARVYDYGEDDRAYPPYLVMELVEGPSLAGVLTQGPLDAASTMDLIAQTAAGLAAAHQAGVVHRDVKPGNLLLSRHGRVKITDFGIAYAVGSAPLTCTGTLVGTPGYLAPERVSGASGTPAADLYALGVVAYECLAGSPPFGGDPVVVAVAHRDRPLPPLPAGVPAEVAALVADLTEKEPAARPASAGEAGRRAAGLRDALACEGGRGLGARTGRALPSGTLPSGALSSGVLSSGVLSFRALSSGAPSSGVPSFRAPSSPALAAWATGSQPAAPPTGGEPAASPAPTPASTMPPGPPARASATGPSWRVRSVVLAVAASTLSAGLAGWLLAGLFQAVPAPQGRSSAASAASARQGTAGGRAAGRTITVNGSSLLGRPVGAVREQLRALGLQVRVQWRPQGQSPPGTVVAMYPSGVLPANSVVLVTAAKRPARAPGYAILGQGSRHGDGHGYAHGHGDGGGNGD